MTEHQRQLLSAYLDDALDAHEALEFASLLDSTDGNPDLAKALQTYVLIGESLRGRAATSRGGIAARVSDALRDEPVPARVVSESPDTGRSGADGVVPLERRRRATWPRMVRSFAMAATVAALAIGGVRLMNADAEVGTATSLDVAEAPVNTIDASAKSQATPAALDNDTDAGPAAGTLFVSTSKPISPTALKVANLSAPLFTPVISASTADGAAQTQEWNRLQPNVADRMQAYFLQHSEVTRNGVRGMLPYARLVSFEADRP